MRGSAAGRQVAFANPECQNLRSDLHFREAVKTAGFRPCGLVAGGLVGRIGGQAAEFAGELGLGGTRRDHCGQSSRMG